MTALGRFLTLHSVSVETEAGAGAFGDTYTTTQAVAGFVEESVDFTYTVNGEQVTDRGTKFYTAMENLPAFAIGAQVTLWVGQSNQRATRVASVARREIGIASVDHCEVGLL